METFGIVMVIVLAALAVAGVITGVACILMKYKANLMTKKVIPEIGKMMEDYTEEMLQKSMTAAKDWMKTME